DKAPYELSGGEMQRVALASILVMDPQVIVLDEPFGNLDWRGRKALFSNLLSLHNKGCYDNSEKLKSKKTIVVFDHQIDPIIRIADRLIIIDQGRIVQNDDPRMVFSNADAINMPCIVRLFHRLKQEEITNGKTPLTPEELSERLAMHK
ncbi:MAG: ATP-binding cassette domain-containing protein, partial [Candidatus Hodarchaeota archaeon]